MHLSDYAKWIGAVRLLRINMEDRKGRRPETELYFPVRICAVQTSYGRFQAKVTPVGGRGEYWVAVDRLQE